MNVKERRGNTYKGNKGVVNIKERRWNAYKGKEGVVNVRERTRQEKGSIRKKNEKFKLKGTSDVVSSHPH